MVNKHTILVVDDEPDIRTAMRSELSVHGYEVLAASDGEQAMQTLTGQKVDVVLLDINMPRANGFKVLEFIKSKSLPSKVIMLSANADLNNVFKAKHLDAHDFISKPYTVEEVLSAITRVLK
jgi:DNA-binding NtrC family response regulator